MLAGAGPNALALAGLNGYRQLAPSRGFVRQPRVKAAAMAAAGHQLKAPLWTAMKKGLPMARSCHQETSTKEARSHVARRTRSQSKAP
jgi:hypothetical protein